MSCRPAAALGLLILLLVPPAAAHPPVEHEIDRVTRVLAQDPSAERFLERAELNRAARRWDAAEDDVRRALEADPLPEGTRLCHARIALERGDHAVAVQRAEAAVAHAGDGTRAEALRTLARALALAGRPGESVGTWECVFRTAEVVMPEDFLAAAEQAARADAPGAGIAWIDAGLARLGPLPVLQAHAYEICRGRGDTEAALERLAVLIRTTPRPEAWLLERGRVLSEAGRRPEAWVAFTDALAAVERLPDHHRNTAAVRTLEAELRARLRPSPGEATP